jgi:hypothetical protein
MVDMALQAQRPRLKTRDLSDILSSVCCYCGQHHHDGAQPTAAVLACSSYCIDTLVLIMQCCDKQRVKKRTGPAC